MKGRWRRLWGPEQGQEGVKRWFEHFESAAREVPPEVQGYLTRLRNWLWGKLHPEKRRQREQKLHLRMKELQQTIQHALNRLPKGAKQRLAASRTALMIAADLEEVNEIAEALTGEKPEEPMGAFVKIHRDAQGNLLRVLVVDGGTKIHTFLEVQFHELGHLVDYAPGYPALSASREWREVIALEAEKLVKLTHSREEEKELLASALAYFWSDPNPPQRQRELPRCAEFFRRRDLI